MGQWRGLCPPSQLGPYSLQKGLSKWADRVPPWFVNRHMVLGLFLGGLLVHFIYGSYARVEKVHIFRNIILKGIFLQIFLIDLLGLQ